MAIKIIYSMFFCYLIYLFVSFIIKTIKKVKENVIKIRNKSNEESK